MSHWLFKTLNIFVSQKDLLYYSDCNIAILCQTTVAFLTLLILLKILVIFESCLIMSGTVYTLVNLEKVATINFTDIHDKE